MRVLSQKRLGDIIYSHYDNVIAAERKSLPAPASPILPPHLRLTLLARMAIIERAVI